MLLLISKRRKKASNARMKPKSVTVVILKEMPSIVPRGQARKKLQKSNRIAKIPLKRYMSSSEVRKAIVDTFRSFDDIETAQYLQCSYARQHYSTS